MSVLTLSKEEQTIVVFHLMKSLVYSKRLQLSFGLIFVGCLIQWAMFGLLPGIILVFAGNLFLLVEGYDNRVNFGSFLADSDWEKVTVDKLQELKDFDGKMKDWDTSLLDISNTLGTLVSFVILIGAGGTFLLGMVSGSDLMILFSANIAVLLLPHWLTGSRQIQRIPNVLLKIDVVRKLLRQVKDIISDHTVEYFMLLRETGKAKLPKDIKFRLKLKNQPPDFLGFYGQIVLNIVKGNAYPYFYVVLVAKKGFGLKAASDEELETTFFGPKYHTEFKTQGDVEVFVIRQTTTKTSGYHTSKQAMRTIFYEGLTTAAQAAVKP